jgi:hypothetical protein
MLEAQFAIDLDGNGVIASPISPPPVISSVTGDDLIDTPESQAGFLVAGNGVPGATISLFFDSGAHPPDGFSATVDPNGFWSLPISPSHLRTAGSGPEIISAYQTLAGTGFISQAATRQFLIEPAPAPVISSVTGDDLIDTPESQAGFLVAGNGVPGATISLFFDSGAHPPDGFSATVDPNGFWSLPISPSHLRTAGSGPEIISAYQTLAGTGFISQAATRQFLIEPAPAPVISSVTGDDLINTPESQAGFLVTGNGVPGATVNLRLDSNADPIGGFIGEVNPNGSWSIAISPTIIATAGIGPETMTAFQTLEGTGFVSESAMREVYIEAPPVPRMWPVTNDDVISTAESQAGFSIYGIGVPGADVILFLNSGAHPSGGFQAKVDSNGSWSIPIDLSHIAIADTGYETITAFQKLAGTGFVSGFTRELFIEDAPTPRIFPITDDDQISLAESKDGFSVTGNGVAGAEIRLFFSSGVHPDGGFKTQVDSNGTWSIAIDPAIIRAAGAGPETVYSFQTLTGTDFTSPLARRDITIELPVLLTDLNTQYVGKDWEGHKFIKRKAGILTEQTGTYAVSDGYVKFWTTHQWTPGRPAILYAPGWKDGPNATEPNSKSQILYKALKDTYGPTHNIAIVDWSKLAEGTQEPQPICEISVTKQVGECVADALIRTGTDPDKTTLIGHSLGSYVMSAAASALKEWTGQRVDKLTGLDPAFGIGYDIDARNGINDYNKPIPFTSAIAVNSRTYTASDLESDLEKKLASSAGDNDLAAMADSAYLVQYSKTDYAGLDFMKVIPQYHNSVISVFADLITKQIEDPNVPDELYLDKDHRNEFDAAGKRSTDGPFDGVIVAPQPWVDNPTINSPSKAIGWTNGYKGINIYGSDFDDIMYHDRFDKDSGSSASTTLEAGHGNDILIGDDPYDNNSIDLLYGGPGEDTFWFGYKRYGKIHNPYDDSFFIVDGNPTSIRDPLNSQGLNSYAVLNDFDLTSDRLYFRHSIKQIGYKDGKAIDDSLNLFYKGQSVVPKHGNGIGIFAEEDLIAYIPGITSQQAKDVLESPRTNYGIYIDLDDRLFWNLT